MQHEARIFDSKTLASTGLVVLLALGLTACGKSEEQVEDPTATERTAPIGKVETASAPAAPAEPAPVAEAPAAEAPVAEEAAAAPGAGDAASGKSLYMAKGCLACHGINAEGMATFPKLAGTPADDIESKLKKYRAGETLGDQTMIMMPNALNLSDAEIADLAAFLSSL